MIRPSPAHHATTSRPDGDDAAAARYAAGHYRPGLTTGGRIVSGAAIGVIYAGLGVLFLIVRGGDLAQPPRQERLKLFTLPAPTAEPPKDEAKPEPPRDAPPLATPPLATPPPIVPLTAPIASPPMPAIVTSAPPGQGVVATTMAAPAPPAAATLATVASAPVWNAAPGCSIARPGYPVRAKRLQQTGNVVIAVTIAADGRIVAQTVRKSSGYDVLDDAALTTVRSGHCRPSADGRSIASVLTVAFSLDQ